MIVGICVIVLLLWLVAVVALCYDDNRPGVSQERLAKRRREEIRRKTQV